MMGKPCIHGGTRLSRLSALALNRNGGGSTSADLLKCNSRTDGGDHEFNEEMAQ